MSKADHPQLSIFELVNRDALPCPFCGHDDIVFLEGDPGPERDDVWLRCEKCLACGPTTWHDLNALKGWNKAQRRYFLPDELEDGYVLREMDDMQLKISIADEFSFWLVMEVGPSQTFFEPSQAPFLGLPDLSDYYITEHTLKKNSQNLPLYDNTKKAKMKY